MCNLYLLFYLFEPVLRTKIKMLVDLCTLGVVYTVDVINLYCISRFIYLNQCLIGLLFMYFTYLFTFITFVNEDVGGFVH